MPSEILSKPSKLNGLEFSLIKQHSDTGYEILKRIQFPWPIALTILQHHERMNGSGYPGGLSGDNICLEARIIAVADVVEAMSSHRPYRPSLGIGKAFEEISKNSGILYDPNVVDACVSLDLNRAKGKTGDGQNLNLNPLAILDLNHAIMDVRTETRGQHQLEKSVLKLRQKPGLAEGAGSLTQKR